MSGSPPRTLADLLVVEGSLGRRALDVLRPAAAALDALHDRGRVHRGIRPSAVRLGPPVTLTAPEPAPDDHDPGSVPSGTLAGLDEPVYSAPEEVSRAVSSHRSDVYAFGCVAFEAITGTAAFTVSALLEQVSESVPSARAHGADVPDEVDDVFGAALATSPENRPPSASAIVDDLAAAFGGRYRPRAGPALRGAVLLSAGAAVAGIAFLVIVIVLAAAGGA